MRESSEPPQSLPRRPVGEAIMYGIGKVIEKRTPTANAELIEGIIAQYIIPKLSPEQRAWVIKHRDAIETACVIAGVGMTVGEIALAVAVGVKAMKFSRERTKGLVRTVNVPVSREAPGVPAAVAAGGLAVAASSLGIKFVDYPHPNLPYGFTTQQLLDLRDRIKRLRLSDYPRDRKLGDQLLKVHWWDLEPLFDKEQKQHERKMLKIGRAVKKHWQNMADTGDKTADWEGMLKGLRQFRHGETDGTELQYFGGGEDATPLDREARVSEAKAYERQYTAKKEKERRAAERRRALRIAFASRIASATGWRNPEVVGALEQARRGKTPEDHRAVADLARFVDWVDGCKDTDRWVWKLLAHARAAQRFGDSQGLVYATESLLERFAEVSPVNRSDIQALALYWRSNLKLAGIDLLMPRSDPTTDRRHLLMMMKNREPSEMARILLDRITRVTDFDEDMPFDVGNVVRDGAVVLSANGDPYPSPSLLHVLRRGYRLLLSTITDEEQAQRDASKAKWGNTYEHSLLPEEEKAIENIGIFIVQNNPDRFLAPLVSDPKFSEERRDAILVQQAQRGHEAVRTSEAKREAESARWDQEAKWHLIGSILRDIRRQYAQDPASMRPLLKRLERLGGWTTTPRGDVIPNAALYTLMRRAYREYKRNEDMPWQPDDDAVARDLARLFARNGGPGLSELFALNT